MKKSRFVQDALAMIQHTVGRDPDPALPLAIQMRFDVGEIKFRPDHEWQSGLRPLARATVSLFTAPLRFVYGYARWSKPRIESERAASPVGPSDAPPSFVESRDDSPRGKHSRTYQ